MFQIGKGVEIIQPPYSVNFNTDSIFDLMSGTAVVGHDGKWYVNGGLSSSITSAAGRAGMFKSTFAASLMMRCAALYDTQVYLADSEDSVTRSLDRVCRFAGDHASKLTPDYIVPIDASTEYDLAKLLSAIKDIGEEKLKQAKEITITTPFIDPKTGERVKTMMPTIVMVDSLSEMHSAPEDTMINDLSLSDSKVKTAYMLDSNQKTLWVRHAKAYAAKYGIQLILTAHYGQKLNLDSYLPAPKALQWQSQNESTKGTGAKFNFLSATAMLINGCVKLMDDAKQCKYQLTKNNSPTELSELTILMQRCKNNSSGLQHPFVVSQENGLLTDASDYNFLRSNKAFGFNGNNVTHQCMFYPEVSMTRNSFRGICQKDHKLTRALQLAAQLLYIQLNWSDANWAFPIKVDPKALVDALYSDKNKMSVDRILNSRSYWLPEEIKDDKEYMSIFDILQFVNQCSLVKT